MGRVRMLRLLLCALALLALCAACMADEGAWDKVVNIDLKDVDVGKVLESLFRGSGLNYTIQPEVAGVISSFSIKNVPFRMALDSITKATGLVYRIDDGVVLIAKRGLGDKGKTPVSVGAPCTPLRDVLDILFKETGVNFGLDQSAKDIIVADYNVRDVPLKEALDLLGKRTGTEYMVDENGTVTLQAQMSVRSWQWPVNLEVKDIPLTDVLEMLFKGTGISYTVDSNIAGLKVSAVLKNVPLEVVLKSVLKAAGASYQIDGGIVSIQRRGMFGEVTPSDYKATADALARERARSHGPTPAPGNPSSRADSTSASDANQRQVSQTLNFQNVNAGDVAPMLQRPNVQIATTSNNQAVVTGPEDAVNEAASLASALDQKSPDKLSARLITLKAQLEFRRPFKGNIRFADDLVSPIISTLDGQKATLKLSTQFPSNSARKTSNSVSLSLTPTIRTDGRINISGAFDYDMDGYFCIRDAKIAATLEPGRPQKQPTINIPSNDGKSKATMDLTLTATLGDRTASPR